MPLYECAGTGKYEMAEMLLQCGADPNASVYTSGDPVFQAYSQRDRWGRLELVELLLARGADPIEADAEPWATPIAWAERRGHQQIALLLRARGATR